MNHSRKRLLLVALAVFLPAVLLVVIFTRKGPGDQPSPGGAVGSSSPRPARPSVLALAPRVAQQPALPGGAFSGRVLSWATGEAVAGAQVTFSGQDGTRLTARTNREGAFTFEPRAPGRYTLVVASAEGFLPFSPQPGSGSTAVVARPDVRIDDLTLFLRPKIEYTGLVQGSGGAPAAGATVQLLEIGQGELAASELADRFVTDQKGEFRFHAPQGTLLEARHPTLGFGRARLAGPSVSIAQRVVIQLALQSEQAATAGTGSIVGRVIDRSGAPVPAALVRGTHVAGRGLHPSREARAEVDGRFRLDGLDPGVHVVWVVCRGCASTRARAATGTEVTLTVGEGATIAGRVVSGSDQPVPAFSVQVSRRRGMHEVVLEEVSVLDAEGRFEIAGIPDGDYQVRAAARGLAPSPPTAVTIGEDLAPPPELLVRLTAGGTVHGKVTDRASGAPLAGVRVAVEGSTDDRWAAMPLAISAVTDQQGAFTLAGVEPGRQSIRAVAADGYHPRMVSGLRVDDGGKVGPVEIALDPARPGEQPRMELFGIGAALNPQGDALVITQLVAGGGAETAGLTVGDGIVEVDGERVMALGVRGAVERTRGPEGTRVVLAVRRAGAAAKAVNQVTVERRAFRF